MKQNASYRLATREIVQVLSKVSATRSVIAIGGDWLIIASAAMFGSQFPSSAAAYAVACLLIASRQHALLVLMHEGAHGHLFANVKWNDRLCNLFTSWPFGISMERYRDHHWKHHQFTNTANDPDWGRKVESAHWQFPKTKARFWADFLPYLWGLGLRELAFALYALGTRPRTSPAAFAFYGLAGVAITAAGAWMPVLKFWLVPYLTVLPVLMKVRSIAEHLGLPNESELTASRNIIGSPVEEFFFGPHRNSLHLIHHLFPQVPWFRLAALRQALRIDQGFREQARENRGYFLPFPDSTLRDLVRQPESAAQPDRAAA